MSGRPKNKTITHLLLSTSSRPVQPSQPFPSGSELAPSVSPPPASPSPPVPSGVSRPHPPVGPEHSSSPSLFFLHPLPGALLASGLVVRHSICKVIDVGGKNDPGTSAHFISEKSVPLKLLPLTSPSSHIISSEPVDQCTLTLRGEGTRTKQNVSRVE
ncbi:hypothetical protein CY34DRAFT_15576 [Suillus luteus UH-Slu-Lm8-n1]|uniref:Uncharacterized protein n=1 Tax=Suillus luteus UH-Slu-Lm8-n1 TaxID=930992 RepID=A0A0D0AHL7_9AGAM|nr:hypothetical protein CY34DRAFT_15576 [Suillus luteus UH-Slu-Lm8-n1]